MPVRYGILCGRCSKFHFICAERKNSRIRYDGVRGEFKVTCILPCVNTISFQRGMLSVCIVPEEDLQRGYSDFEDCPSRRRIVANQTQLSTLLQAFASLP